MNRKLVYKGYTEHAQVNGNKSMCGAYLFDKIDISALTWMSEEFLTEMRGVYAVTNEVKMQFNKSVFPFGYLEIYAECVDITPARIDIKVEMMYRDRDTIEYEMATNAIVSFSIIDENTRKLKRIPREVMNAIKG
jgi:acyl-CoA hydrolase